MTTHRLRAAVVAGLTGLALAWSAHLRAANVTWDGSDSTAWNTGANWTLNAAPAAGDFLFFTSGNPTNQPSNNDASGLSLSGLTFLNSTFTAPLSLGGNALTLSATTTAGASFSRNASTTVTVTQADHGLVTGQYVTFATGSSNFNTTAQVTVLTGSTFTYVSSSNASATITGTYTPATLNNLNTTAGRDVTIANALAITGTQFWAAPNASAVTTISGNLSGTVGSSITVLTNDTKSTLPSIRLSGNNAGYLGNIFTNGNGTSGIMLVNADAMIGGSVSINGTDQGLWLNGSTATNGGVPVGTYTFLPGKVAGGVESRNAGTNNGIHVTGGDITWRPGNTSSYATTTGTSMGGLIRIGPQATGDSTTPYVINFGNVGDTISSGTFANATGSPGNGPAIFEVQSSGGNTIFNIRSALSGTGNFSLGAPLGILNASSTGSGRLTVGSGGALSISSMSQLPSGNLNVAGTLILDGISWSTFAAARGSGTGAGQWQSTSGFGFAARGSAVTIDSQSTDATTFDKNFSIGSGLLGSNGQLYATAGVTIAANTTLTGNRTVTVGNNGIGIGTGTPVLNRISGNLSGTGSIVVQGGNVTTPGELVLAGTNSWSGGSSSNINSAYFNTGPGGLQVSEAVVEFDGDAALPSGNGGAAAFVGAVVRNSNAPFGYLLAGGTANRTYDLPAGYRFLLGSVSTQIRTPLLGADGGIATLQASTVLVHSGAAAADTQSMNLLVRTNSTLALGSSGGSVKLVPSTGQSSGTSAVATTVSDATGARTLIKRGEGTLILGNVAYTNVAETGTTSSQFAWQVGRGSGGNGGGSAYFDGAVRGLSPNDPAANDSNSLKNFFLALRGGVYEIDNSSGGSSTFAAALGISGTGKVSVGNISGNSAIGGGGFAAFGGNVTVTLSATSGTTTNLQWGQTNSGFVQSGDPLMFGSETASAKLDFTNAIDLNGGSREVRVYDNPATPDDYAVMSGVLSGNSASGINKTGVGLLELSAVNTYSGTTTVSAGTLRIANNLALQNSSLDTSGAGAVTLTVTTPTFGGLVGSANLSTVISSGYGSVSAITFNPGAGLTRTYTGAITDGATGMTLTKTGAGTQVLGGDNSYTGNTTVSAGTLQLGVGASLPGNIANAASLVLLQGGTGAGVASGVLSGTGSVTMSGTGVVRLSNTANTYTGKTTVTSGVLEIVSLADSGASSSLGMPTGANATIDLGSSTTAGTLRYVGSGNTSDRTINTGSAGGIVDASGSGALNMSSGTISAASNSTVTLTGSSTFGNSIGPINGPTSTDNGVNVTKTGPGLWQITGDGNYSGQLTVLDGTIVAGANVNPDTTTGVPSPFGRTNPILGNSAANITGTAAILAIGSGTINRGLSIAALDPTSSQVAVLGMTGTGTAVFSTKAISVGRDLTLQASNGGTAEFNTIWAGATGTSGPGPAFVFTVGSSGNAGTVRFGNDLPSTLTGVTVVNGTAQLKGGDDRITPTTPVTVGSTLGAASLDLNGVSQTLSRLTFAGNSGSVTTGTATGGMLRLANSGSVAVSGTGHVISSLVDLVAPTTFTTDSASMLTVNNVISSTSGAVGLTKAGAGILELTAANTYSGNTIVSQGTLALGAAGSFANSGTITVGNAGSSGVVLDLTAKSAGFAFGPGQTLKGGGTLRQLSSGTVTVAGLFSPGNSPGLFTYDGGTTLLSGTTLMEIWGTSRATSPSHGTGFYDAVNVVNGGILNFSGGTLELTFSQLFDTDTSFSLFGVLDSASLAGNFTGVNVSGSFYTGLSWSKPTSNLWKSSETTGGQSLEFNASNGTLVIVVPEPGAITLAAIGIAAAAWAARRRRR